MAEFSETQTHTKLKIPLPIDILRLSILAQKDLEASQAQSPIAPELISRVKKFGEYIRILSYSTLPAVTILHAEMKSPSFKIVAPQALFFSWGAGGTAPKFIYQASEPDNPFEFTADNLGLDFINILKEPMRHDDREDFDRQGLHYAGAWISVANDSSVCPESPLAFVPLAEASFEVPYPYSIFN